MLRGIKHLFPRMILSRLLHGSVNPDILNQQKQTPVMLAAMHGRIALSFSKGLWMGRAKFVPYAEDLFIESCQTLRKHFKWK
ncbi:RING-type E3 ubiquitin transferase [Trifolium repens]|nr:RING-type E3 ubiquitin transferase [Trifolium repens]